MTVLRGPDPYALAEEQLMALPPAGHYDATICRILHTTIPTYSWVGIFRPAVADLTLVAWAGTEQPHTLRLHVNDGAEYREENELTAGARPGRFSPAARAETAIPFGSPTGIGLLAIASEHRGAFGPADRELLHRVATILSDRA